MTSRLLPLLTPKTQEQALPMLALSRVMQQAGATQDDPQLTALGEAVENKALDLLKPPPPRKT